MEDKDNIIKQQAAYIRALEFERDRWQELAQAHEEEINKLYHRPLWQRILNLIPE